jgi:hypothetical protein
LQSNNFTKDEKTYYKSNIIAERISVLSWESRNFTLHHY